MASRSCFVATDRTIGCGSEVTVFCRVDRSTNLAAFMPPTITPAERFREIDKRTHVISLINRSKRRKKEQKLESFVSLEAKGHEERSFLKSGTDSRKMAACNHMKSCGKSSRYAAPNRWPRSSGFLYP